MHKKSKTIDHSEQVLLRDAHYAETMIRVRHHLSPTERTFSKLIHVSIIEELFELLGRTLMNPIILASAFFTATAGYTVLLPFTLHYGYYLPHSMYIVLFATGYFAGTIYVIASGIRQKRL